MNFYKKDKLSQQWIGPFDVLKDWENWVEIDAKDGKRKKINVKNIRPAIEGGGE